MNKLLFLKLLIGLIALSGCSGNNQPENPVRFEPVASMPTDGRASAVAFAVDGKGYVLGGRSGVRSGILSDFWMYNPEYGHVPCWQPATPQDSYLPDEKYIVIRLARKNGK